ncbi:hypothetical protein ACP4OV_001671 [Aristida adscensionis]
MAPSDAATWSLLRTWPGKELSCLSAQRRDCDIFMVKYNILGWLLSTEQGRGQRCCFKSQLGYMDQRQRQLNRTILLQTSWLEIHFFYGFPPPINSMVPHLKSTVNVIQRNT